MSAIDRSRATTLAALATGAANVHDAFRAVARHLDDAAVDKLAELTAAGLISGAQNAAARAGLDPTSPYPHLPLWAAIKEAGGDEAVRAFLDAGQAAHEEQMRRERATISRTGATLWRVRRRRPQRPLPMPRTAPPTKDLRP